jgi:hypothetical protein
VLSGSIAVFIAGCGGSSASTATAGASGGSSTSAPTTAALRSCKELRCAGEVERCLQVRGYTIGNDEVPASFDSGADREALTSLTYSSTSGGGGSTQPENSVPLAITKSKVLATIAIYETPQGASAAAAQGTGGDIHPASAGVIAYFAFHGDPSSDLRVCG